MLILLLGTSVMINFFLGGIIYFFIKIKDEESYIRKYQEYIKNLSKLIKIILLKKECITNIYRNKQIIIYGCGQVGEILYLLLKDVADIQYFMDKNHSKNKTFKEVPILKKGAEIPELNSIIIVSVLYNDAKAIKDNLKKIYGNEVITLKEVINGIICE